jgi:glycosyltransferase involved in cell wall biosynthesis
VKGPLVSAVMPVYNAEEFLAESLQSVFAQDYEPIEVIVVNDGSQDRSGEIARSFPGVRYYEQENQGASTARNHAIARANGEFVAFADADDVLPPTKLSTQVGYLLEYPDVACTLGRQHWLKEPPGAVRDAVWGDIDGIPLVSIVVRRSIIQELGGLHAAPTGDLDFLVRLREAGYKHVVLPEIVLHRRYHGENLVAGRGITPLPPMFLKAKLDRERARRGEQR